MGELLSEAEVLQWDSKYVFWFRIFPYKFLTRMSTKHAKTKRPLRQLKEADWQRLKVIGELPNNVRHEVEALVANYNIDVRHTVDRLEHASELASRLRETTRQLSASNHQNALALLPKARRQRLQAAISASEEIPSDLSFCADTLRERRSYLRKEPLIGPLRDLIRLADHFWLAHKGKRIQKKGDDPVAWAFLVTLASVVAPKAKAETLRRYFRDHQNGFDDDYELDRIDEPYFYSAFTRTQRIDF